MHQAANLSRCRVIFPVTSSDRTPRTARSRYRCVQAVRLSSASARPWSRSVTFREAILRRSSLSATGRGVVIAPVYFTEGLFPETMSAWALRHASECKAVDGRLGSHGGTGRRRGAPGRGPVGGGGGAGLCWGAGGLC